MKKIINRLIERWNAETPKLFKRLQRLGITIASAATIITTASFDLPAYITHIAGVMGTISVIIAVICQFAIHPDKDV